MTISNIVSPPLCAFGGQEERKASLVEQVAKHSAAGEVVPGPGAWDGQKGSLIGVTIHATDPERFETEVGIDRGLLNLAETWWRIAFYAAPLHMPAWQKLDPAEVEEVRQFPCSWLTAIPTGADTGGIAKEILIWCIEQTLLDIGPKDDQASELVAIADELVQMHQGASASREDWRSLRRRCVALRDSIRGYNVLGAAATTIETAAWPLGKSGSTIADTLAQFVNLVIPIVMAAEGWSEEDEAKKSELDARLNAAYEKAFAIEDAEERAIAQSAVRKTVDDAFDSDHPGLRERSIALATPTGLAKWERLIKIKQTLLDQLQNAPLPATSPVQN